MLMREGSVQLEISKKIGEPISPELPVPVELEAMCNVVTAEPGEKVWRYTATDTTADVVYNVNADGSLDEVKRTPTGDAEITFQGLNSKKEYVLIDDILGETDNVGVLGRRKASITRGMDKKEVYAVLQAVTGQTALGQSNANFVPGVACQSVVPASGDDLYDVILAMKHKVEDYGDDYLLLEGSDVKEAIDSYSKDKVTSHNYNVKLREEIKGWGMQEMKVYGTFQDEAAATYQVMNKKYLVMIARNTRIADGKPITFVRRRISPEIAKFIKASPDNMQRLIIGDQAPQLIGSSDTFAYSVWGYESVIFLITNPYAIVFADVTSVL